MDPLILVPYAIIGAAAYGIFIHLPCCCIRYGWWSTLHGLIRSF